MDVKSEMPIGHASGDVENSVKHMSLEFRGEVQGRNVDVAVAGVYIYKAKSLDGITYQSIDRGKVCELTPGALQ